MTQNIKFQPSNPTKQPQKGQAMRVLLTILFLILLFPFICYARMYNIGLPIKFRGV